MSLTLTPRLKAALELISYNHKERFNCILDIGCDHGKLSVALIERGITEKVIASDISSASLHKAEILAQSCGYEEKLITICCNGMEGLTEFQADCAVLLGMGGELIANILDAQVDYSHSLKRIITQPMRGEAELREYLYTHGYKIVAERIVFDAGRYYQLLAAEPGEADELPDFWPQGYFQFGAQCYKSGDELMQPMLERYLNIMKAKLLKAGSGAPNKLYDEVKNVEIILEHIRNREGKRHEVE